MKRCYITFIMMLVLAPCKADNFVIKAMNVSQIAIGGKMCTIGSEFSDEETISWSDDNVEIIEAQNTRTKEIWQFTKKSQKDSRTSTVAQFCSWVTDAWGAFKNYFVNNIHLSTREVETYDIDEYSDIALSREFNLIDTISIDTKHADIVDREYFASYHIKGEKRTVSLSYENGCIIFARDQFITDDMQLPKKLVLTIYYIENGLFHKVTNGMCVTIVEPAVECSANFVFQ